MATYNKFNSFTQKLTDKAISFTVDVFKLALTNTAPVATNTVISNITQIANGNGYTTGGAVTTITETTSSGTVKESGTAVTWTGVTAPMGPFQYVVFYDSTTNDLVGWWDYGSAVTLQVGDTFTATPDVTNGLFTLT
jgi:hypothetical protein